MYKKALTFFVLLFSVVTINAHAEYDEGIEYLKLSPPVPTQTGNKIEVVEMFWYGCPHCFRLEPLMKQWLKDKPANVEFIRIPAVLNANWAMHAKAFYTAEILGVLDKIHDDFFEAIHVKKKHMHTKKDIREFFIAHGVKAEDFDNTFDSFMVNIKVNRAHELGSKYHLDGVPTIIVNGKYQANGPMATNHKRMMKIVDYLIKKEQK